LEDVRERMSRPANMRGGTFFKVGGGHKYTSARQKTV